MKKLLVLFTMIITIILSGCSAEMEPEVTETSFYDYIQYKSYSMSYTNDSESDILYFLDNTYLDFYILNEVLLEYNLSSEEQTAYQQLFIILDELTTKSSFSYRLIDEYSSKDFKSLCDSNAITVTLSDIVTFNSLKTLIPDINTALETRSSEISKIDYVGKILNRSLTDEEISSLDFLQIKYNELFYTNYQAFNFQTNTLEDLLIEFETQFSYVPNDFEFNKLEIAYDLLTQLFNE